MNVETLSKFYPHPLLLLGAPGVGKSETVYQLSKYMAEQMGLKMREITHSSVQEILKSKEPLFLFYDLRLSEVEPCDLMGLPREVEEGFAYKPPLWALCFARHPGILFLDELTNVQRDDVVSASYKIVLERRVGDVQFSPGVWVISAGNTPEYSAVARELPAPLINRLIVINFPTPTIDEWAEYMNSRGTWDRRTYAYLKLFPEDFLKPQRASTLENFPTPRSWTKLAQLMPNVQDAVQVLAKGCLGAEVGEKFLAFISNPIPPIKEILDNPERFLELGLDTKYMFISVLASWLSEERAEEAKGLVTLLAERERELLVFLFSCLPKERRIQIFKAYSAERKISEALIQFIRYMVEV